MTAPHYHLPGVLSLISEMVNEDAAVKLAKKRGGREIYIARNPSQDDVLSEIVGLDDARLISDLLGHGNLRVPMGNLGGQGGRQKRIQELRREGLTMPQIAAEVDVSLRTVERTVSDMGADKQPELPF